MNTLATLEGVEDLLNNFVETVSLVLPGKKLVKVTTQLIKVALGLPDEGTIETERNYVVSEEIFKKGLIHQVKDVPNSERREQFQIYLQNVALVTKTEDMSAKKYTTG